MLNYFIQSVSNGMFLSVTDQSGIPQPQPGDKLVMNPAQAQLASYCLLIGVTAQPQNKHGYILQFVDDTSYCAIVPGTTAGLPIEIFGREGSPDQLFTLLPSGNGLSVQLMSVATGQVIDIPAFSTTPGVAVQQWPANGGTNQQWNVTPIIPQQASTLQVAVRSQYQTTGKTITLTGTGYAANTTYSIWFTNVPGVPQTQAWQDSTSGEQLLPTTTLTSNAQGNISAEVTVNITSFNTQDGGGNAVVLLETAGGAVQSFALVPRNCWVYYPA